MRNFFALATILITATPALAAGPSSKKQDCEKFSNAAFAGEPSDVRTRLSVNAINSAYGLGYQEADLDKIAVKSVARIKAGKMSLDGLERVALFGCTNEMADDDSIGIKKIFEDLRNEK